jgi:hypothetical protein
MVACFRPFITRGNTHFAKRARASRLGQAGLAPLYTDDRFGPLVRPTAVGWHRRPFLHPLRW